MMLAMLQSCTETTVVGAPAPSPAPPDPRPVQPQPAPQPVVVSDSRSDARSEPQPVSPGPSPQPEVVAAARSDCELVRYDGGATFLVETWAVPDQEFDVGEPLRLQLRVSSPAYVNIFHVGTSCKVTRLLHNHSINATEIVDFPLPGSGIEIIVKPPEGLEGFYVVATRKELAFLAADDIRQGGSGIASLDLDPGQFYQRLEDMLGRVNPADWSVTTLLTSVGPWPYVQ